MHANIRKRNHNKIIQNAFLTHILYIIIVEIKFFFYKCIKGTKEK